MIFRKAKIGEKDTIMKIYRSVTVSPYTTWNEAYPSEEDLEKDLLNEDVYLLCDGEDIVGAVTFSRENEHDGYEGWRIKENASEFLRAAILFEHQGKGFSKILISEMLSELKKRGFAAVHILAARKNIPAQRLYLSLGFEARGEAYFYENYYSMLEKRL